MIEYQLNESDEFYPSSMDEQAQEVVEDDNRDFWSYPEEREQFPPHIRDIASLCRTRTGVDDIVISKDLPEGEDYHVFVVEGDMYSRWAVVFPRDGTKMRPSSLEYIEFLVDADLDDDPENVVRIAASLTRDELREHPDLSDPEVLAEWKQIYEESRNSDDQHE